MDVSATTPVLGTGHVLLLLALALGSLGTVVAGIYLMRRLNRRAS
jgi:hypothetical protein